MPNWWDEDVPADAGGGEGNWWEEDADQTPPKKKDAFSALRGAQIKAQPSLLSRVGSQTKGFFQELPLIASRGFNVLEDIASGNAAMNAAGNQTPEEQSKQILASEKRYRERQRLNDLLGGAKPGEDEQRWGRIGARMVPGFAAAAATGGGSVAGQGLIQGGVQALQSLSEGASPEAAATGALIAGLGPGAGQTLNAGLSKLKAPFARSVNRPAMEAFERLGVEPPAAAVSNSRLAGILEQGAAFSPGGHLVTNRAEKALSGLKGKADELAAGANLTGSGMSLSDDYATARASLQAAKNAEYGKIGDLKQFPSAAEQTLAEIDGILERGTAAPDVLERLKVLRKAIAPAVPENLENLGAGQWANDPNMAAIIAKQDAKTAAEMAPTPRSVADLMSQQAGIEYGGPNALRDAGLGNRIRQKLGADVDAALGQAAPEQLAQLQKAKEAYGRYADLSESLTGRTVSKLSEAGQFDKVIPSIIKPGASVKDIRTVLSISRPGTVEQIRKDILADIVGSTGGATVKITPEKIADGIKRWKPAILREVLDKEQYKRLQDLSLASQSMGKATRISGGSQTAPLIRAGHYLSLPSTIIPLILTGNVGPAAAIAGGVALEGATALGIGSKKGQQWLTQGLKPASRPGHLIRAGSVPLSRLPSELEMDRRRQELDALLAGSE